MAYYFWCDWVIALQLYDIFKDMVKSLLIVYLNRPLNEMKLSFSAETTDQEKKTQYKAYTDTVYIHNSEIGSTICIKKIISGIQNNSIRK